MAKARRTVVLIRVALLVALSLPIGACAKRREPSLIPAGGSVAGAVFTDEVGRPVRPRATPARRLVSLAPNVTELLFALGAGDQVVGVDNYSDQPAGQVAGIPKVGTDYEPSEEKILGLSPDLVLTSLSANRRETVESLERLGLPVFVTDTRSVVDMDRTFRGLGAVTGHARQAEEQIARLHGGLEAIARRVVGRPKPRVLVVVWDNPLYVAGKGTFTQDLIETAGGTNVAADVSGFVKYPLERVLRLSPEVIIMPTHSRDEQGSRAVDYWSQWPELPAVRAKRVTTVDDAIISRAGARLVEGADLLAHLIHPEIGPRK